MRAKTQDTTGHRDEPSPTAETTPEPNSNVQDAAAPAHGGAEAQIQSPQMQPPIDADIGEDADAEPPPAPDVGSRPNPKRKKPASPKRAKANKISGSDKRAAERPGDAGDGGNDTAADEGAPVLRCLQVARIEPAALPPAGTLPPELEAQFPDVVSVAALLAATAAAAGHGVWLEAGKDANGEGGSLALRVAIVGEERGLPQAVAPVLQAAYEVEAQEVQRWSEAKQRADLQGGAYAVRRRLYQQMVANAGLLQIRGPSDGFDPTIVATSSALPRPCFALRDPVPNDVKRCLEATRSGVLLIDGRRMPTMAGWGVNYDLATASLLNAAAAGRALELADPRADGCIRMRPVAVSVIGTLSVVDIFSLHKVTRAALAATVFVPAEEKSNPHLADAAKTATKILGRVRALGANPQDSRPSLRLSAAARKTLEQAKVKFVRAAAAVLPPLAHYYAAAADLTHRVAYLLNILDSAARQADRMSAEVGKDSVLRAVAFVEQCLLPSARSILAPASVAPERRDARRIVSFAQQYASVEHPQLVQREVGRYLRRSMTVAEFDRATRLLVADGLLAASSPDAAIGVSHAFHVHEAVFEPKHQLPDLVTDPRRPRQ